MLRYVMLNEVKHLSGIALCVTAYNSEILPCGQNDNGHFRLRHRTNLSKPLC